MSNVADLYLRPTFRIRWFADLTRVHFSPTHVQWFYTLHPWFPVPAADVPGCLNKGFAYVRPRIFQNPCVGALSLNKGGYAYRHPFTLTQTARAAAGPDLVWWNRSERWRADRCAVAGFRGRCRVPRTRKHTLSVAPASRRTRCGTYGGRQGQPGPGSVLGRHVGIRGAAAAPE